MKNFHHTENCPIRDILSRLSSKWAMLILITLDANEVMRFNDLQKSIGDISQRMLSVTLRTLEADGLIGRKAYPEIPPRVEYSLTPRGLSLIPYLEGLVGWALANMPQIMNEREEKVGFLNRVSFPVIDRGLSVSFFEKFTESGLIGKV